MIFFKATPSLVGPNDDLIMPKDARKVDWEVELVVVIGKRGGYIEREDALEYVAGYALHNDYSERVFQLERSGQWVKGKSADTFAPLRTALTEDTVNFQPHSQMRRVGNLVACGQERSQLYLKPGDVVELGIDHLGESRQSVVAWLPATAETVNSRAER